MAGGSAVLTSQPPRAAEAARPPIFVGGTGRSGTTVTGALLGSHPEYAVIPVEAKFHAEPVGLPGLATGRVTPAAIAEWIERLWEEGSPDRGLATVVSRRALDKALERFRARADEKPVQASRRLIRDVFGGYARRQGASGWVEMTPRALLHAPHLLELFPTARFVHVMRDGRDVAASLVGKEWKSDAVESIAWWEMRMRQLHKMTASLPAESVHVVRFDRLMRDDREAEYGALLDFLGWDDEPGLRRFFTEEMTPDRAHIGRWREDFPPEVRRDVARAYRDAIKRLRRANAAVP